MENRQPENNRKERKLTLLQYVIYLGVTPCALAALALLVFILVKRPGSAVPSQPTADTVESPALQ